MAIGLGTLVKQKRTSSGAEPRQLLPHFDVGDFTHKPKNGQEPQDNDNDHDGIQNRFNGARHWDESVDEPEKNTNHDQNHNYLS